MVSFDRNLVHSTHELSNIDNYRHDLYILFSGSSRGIIMAILKWLLKSTCKESAFTFPAHGQKTRPNLEVWKIIDNHLNIIICRKMDNSTYLLITCDMCAKFEVDLSQTRESYTRDIIQSTGGRTDKMKIYNPSTSHDDVIKWKFSALLAMCVRNSPVTDEFPA